MGLWYEPPMLLCSLTPTLGGRSWNTLMGRMASTPHCAHLLHKSTRSQQPWCSSDSLWTLGVCSFSGDGLQMWFSWGPLSQQSANHILLTPWLKCPLAIPPSVCREKAYVEVSRVLGWWEGLENEKCAEKIKGSNKNRAEKKKIKTSVSLCKTCKNFLVSSHMKGKWVAPETQ